MVLCEAQGQCILQRLPGSLQAVAACWGAAGAEVSKGVLSTAASAGEQVVSEPMPVTVFKDLVRKHSLLLQLSKMDLFCSACEEFGSQVTVGQCILSLSFLALILE